MIDFLLKFRPLHPLPITPPTRDPVGVTIRTISGISVVETIPNVNIQVRDETFLSISITDWITTGTTVLLRSFNSTHSVIDTVCHPNPVLAAGFIFEIIPVRNPSQRYTVEFPPLAIHAQGVILHVDLKEIFRKIEATAAELVTLQTYAHQEQERQILSSLPRSRRVQFFSRIAPTTSTARAGRGIPTIRQIELEAQQNPTETIEVVNNHGSDNNTEGSNNQTASGDSGPKHHSQ